MLLVCDNALYTLQHDNEGDKDNHYKEQLSSKLVESEGKLLPHVNEHEVCCKECEVSNVSSEPPTTECVSLFKVVNDESHDHQDNCETVSTPHESSRVNFNNAEPSVSDGNDQEDPSYNKKELSAKCVKSP